MLVLKHLVKTKCFKTNIQYTLLMNSGKHLVFTEFIHILFSDRLLSKTFTCTTLVTLLFSHQYSCKKRIFLHVSDKQIST